jgi:glycosyltransferase involved in cell wall biosynthesis
VIATDTCAASDILADGKAGTLVAPNNPEALATAIKRVLFGNEAMVEQLEYAGNRARSVYSLERMLLEISRVISQVSHRAYT